MEKIKNFLVVLLAMTMCLLCFVTLIVMSGTNLSIKSIFTDETEYENPDSQKTVYKNMSIPYRISVVQGETVYTEQGITRTSQCYKDCEKLLFEAVGSMSQLEECTREEYMDAIGSKSLVFSLSGRLPLYLMQMWSGGVDKYENCTSAVALVRESKGVKVYFADDSGKYYRSQTSSANAVIDEIIAGYTMSNGIIVDGMVLSEKPLSLPAYVINNEASFETGVEESLLRAFGFNPYFAKTYQEPDGDKIYVEEDNVLSVSGDGSMTYRSSGVGMVLKNDGTATKHESVALASNKLYEISSILYADHPEITADIIGVKENDGEISINAIIKLGGVPVSEDISSAGVIVRNGGIVKMWIDMPVVTEDALVTVMSDTMAESLHDKDNGRYEIIYTEEKGKLVPVNSFVE